MASMADIQQATDEFITKHWNSRACGEFPDASWKEWAALTGEIPNNDKQGCYALVVDERVFYVGSAVSRGAGKYTGNGIGKRLGDYAIWDRTKKGSGGRRVYCMRDGFDPSIKVFTLGIAAPYGYLALALEDFLIPRFKTDGLVNTKPTTSAH
jgi:hypothetical protein